MIAHADIENVIGCRTLVSDQMQRAIEDWYAAAIDGEPLDHNPDTLSLGLPAVICGELARLTTLELEAKVEGSSRADWINDHLQRVLSPRRRRILSLGLALGSGVWKPYQSGGDLGVAFIPATGYYPVAHDIDGNLTEINVTSPTGIRAIKRLGGPDLAVSVWDAIEAKVTKPQSA